MALQLVALDHGAHAFRRAGVNQVAGEQFNQAGQIGNGLGHIPDQIRQIALLTHFAVDLEPDRALVGMTELRRRHQRCARRRMVETLAHVPWSRQFLGFALQVAARHVEPDGIAVHQLQRLFHRNIAAAFGERHHQFDFMLVVLGLARIRHFAVGRHDGVGRLHEEERRFAVGIVAHFARVSGVVAADAVYATHWKRIAADYRDGSDLWHWDCISHAETPVG